MARQADRSGTFQGANLEHARALNRRAVFEAVRRHGPVTLVRMEAVHLVVEGIVHEVGAAGGEAENAKGDEAPAQRRAVRQDPGGAGRGEDEEVLDPLAWPGRPDESGGQPHRGGRRGGLGIGNRLRARPGLGPAHTRWIRLILLLPAIANLF